MSDEVEKPKSDFDLMVEAVREEVAKERLEEIRGKVKEVFLRLQKAKAIVKNIEDELESMRKKLDF